ncbi:hypothetical protein IWZ03DRAFT_203140 [Phyllosticta citriasiana]|uniref:BTB domain-containing protein n=1 Tax=Phyllosticta citriasiana TaxID=595635 RepID=A0ABR1KI89_9PEZI
MARQIRNDPVSQFMNNLTKFYKSGEHSDMTLKTKDGKEHKVHRIVLRSQSGFFDRAFDSKSTWKEAVSGEMELLNDAPENIQALVDWMYTFSYDCPSHIMSRQERTIFHVQMYALGDIYDAPSLKELAARNFDTDVDHRAELFPDIVRAVYATTPPSDRGLRDRILRVCAANISELLGSSNSNNNANTSASISAESTNRRPFRGRHKHYNARRAQTMKSANEPPTPVPIPFKAEFTIMMDELGVFGRELTTYIAFKSPTQPSSSHAAMGGSIVVHRYRCGVCRKTCGMELPATTGGASDNEQLISCMFCQAGFSPNNWRSRRVGPAEAADEALAEQLAAGSSLDDGAAVRAPPLERADVPSTAGDDGGSLGDWDVRPSPTPEW